MLVRDVFELSKKHCEWSQEGLKRDLEKRKEDSDTSVRILQNGMPSVQRHTCITSFPQKEMVLVSVKVRGSGMRIAPSEPSGCTVTGISSSSANTLRTLSWMRQCTLSVICFP